MKQISRSGKKILFVGTKKQAKDIINECARRVNMLNVVSEENQLLKRQVSQ